jgi:hypothetical protein
MAGGPASNRSAQSPVPAEVADRSGRDQSVYPVDGSAVVKVLGGADPVREVLGYLPDSWQVMPFGAMDPREFLAQLDFFVYSIIRPGSRPSGATFLKRWRADSRRSCPALSAVVWRRGDLR